MIGYKKFSNPRIFFFLFVFWLFLIASYGCSYNNYLYSDRSNTKEVIAAINEKLLKIYSYKANFIIEHKDKSQEKGEIFVKGVDKSKLNIYDNHTGKVGGVIISNGRIKWIYMPMMKIVFKEFTDKSTKTSGWFVPSYIDPSTFMYIGIKVENGEECYVLEGVMEPVSQLQSQYSEINRFFMRKKDGLVVKIISYDKQRQEVESWMFYNFSINIPIEDQEFIFVPPADIQVIETGK